MKARLYDESNPQARDAARAVLRHVLDVSLRLLHPVMPFISEELWLKLPDRETDSLIVASWPEPTPELRDPEAETQMAILQEMLGAVRNIRSEYNVEHGRKIEVQVRSADAALRAALAAEGESARRLGGIADLRLDGGESRGAGASAVLTSGAVVYVPLEGLIDLGRERARLDKQLGELRGLVERSERRLASADFVRKAPAEVVESARQKLEGLREQLARVEEKRRALEVD